MGTTANYSWPTPVATDLVKDGWEAIKDLGDAADTTVKAVSDAQGLIHINTTSFSAVASQSINDVFSATYDHYKIIFAVKNSSDAGGNFRLRVSGTDNSSSNYYWSSRFNSSASGTYGSNISTTAATAFVIHDIGTLDGGSVAIMDLFNPFATARTTFTSQNTYIPVADNQNYNVNRAGGTTVTTSYTGFTFYPASGTMTGSIHIFGYRKS